MICSTWIIKRSCYLWDALILLAVAMMAIVAPTLLSSKIDSEEDVAFYSLHRVMR